MARFPITERLPKGRAGQRDDVVPLRGGLDLVTQAMLVEPGFCLAAKNYEAEARGYRRISGFERFDGRPKPSDAEYFILNFDGADVAVSEDDTVTGGTSGATGIAVADGVLESGSYAGTDGAGYLALYNISGTFQDNESLNVGGTFVGNADGTPLRNGATTDSLHATYIAAVTSKRRDAITKPSGSGPIRGVATYGGDTYCWRDNAGGTAGQMFKATTSGWTAQSFGHYIKFNGGTVNGPPSEGDTLTGASSGDTATIERVVLNDGAWDGTGEGHFVLSSSGAFTTGENLNVSGSTVAVADGAAVAVALPAGGTYRSLTENFFGQSDTERLYFCNGVGYACEWDGTVLVPIFTGVASAKEKPKYIAVQRKHLFLGYAGGSLQHSATGLPLVFDAVQGAGEIAFGQELTGLESHTRDTTIVMARNKIGYLTGTDSSSFDLKVLSGNSGAIEDTLQVVGNPIFMDDLGIRDLQAAETFGDWLIGTQTQLVEPFLRTKRDASVTPAASLRVRGKAQYRLFMSDGSGLILYFGRRDAEAMPFDLGVTVECAHSGENSSGDEILFLGDDDGWVYQSDCGTSFDGASIEAYLRLSFMHQGAPNYLKRYHRGRLEGQAGSTGSAIFVSADFSYSNPDQPSSQESNFTFQGSGDFWDEGAWNEFNWSAAVEGQAFFPLDGLGENISITFMSDSATEHPHTLSSVSVNYTPRRKLR